MHPPLLKRENKSNKGRNLSIKGWFGKMAVNERIKNPIENKANKNKEFETASGKDSKNFDNVG